MELSNEELETIAYSLAYSFNYPYLDDIELNRLEGLIKRIEQEQARRAQEPADLPPLPIRHPGPAEG